MFSPPPSGGGWGVHTSVYSHIPMLAALSSRQAGMGMAKEVAVVPQREKLGAREPPEANLMALVNFPHGSWRALL